MLGSTTVIPLLRAAIHYPASIFHSSLPQMQISLSVVYIRFSNIWKSSYLEESAEARNIPDPPPLPKPGPFLLWPVLPAGCTLCSNDTLNSVLGKELLGVHAGPVLLRSRGLPSKATGGRERPSQPSSHCLQSLSAPSKSGHKSGGTAFPLHHQAAN